MATVALAREFLTAYSRMQKPQQKKIQEFITKFTNDPTQRSINYEPIHDMKDKKVRTVRIDLSYRAVILHPPQGEVYILVWVDHHDEAMRWAKNKVFDIHPNTGGIQVVDMEQIEQIEQSTKEVDPSSNGNGIFQDINDEDLFTIGVPPILFPAIRNIKREEDLDVLQPYVSEEIYEGLFYLLSGYSVDETLEALCTRESEAKIDIDNYEIALQQDDSRRRFVVISSSDELKMILDEPLDQWRIFLHPAQRKVIEGNNGHYEGSIRVLGGAGTGKTVVAMHRAKYLAQKIYNHPKDKILFTTFTKNLANNIYENLKFLCDEASLKRIEITNLHSWAHRFLIEKGYSYKIPSNNEIKHIWGQAVQISGASKPIAFYRDEWEKVIQTYDINSKTEYLRCARMGRGTRLSKNQREEVWEVISTFHRIVEENNFKEWTEIIKTARQYIEENNVELGYKAIIVDEAQDFQMQDFMLIRSMISQSRNDLFIVGDPQQRIYDRKVVLARCGIQVRGKRSIQLKVNYRTTEEIRRLAQSIVEDIPFDNLDGERNEYHSETSLLRGHNPIIRFFDTYFDETQFIIQQIQHLIENGSSLDEICIAARTHELIKTIYKPALQSKKIPFVLMDELNNELGEGVRIATMHRIKGLEFKYVFIPAVNKTILPLDSIIERAIDEVSRQEAIDQEKSLLYVSMTRARDMLYITCFDTPSDVIQKYLKSELL